MTRWLMVMIAAPILAGCAAGTGGLVSGEVLETDGAQVIVVRGYGLQLRSHPADAGMTLGYAKRTYVYSKDTVGLPEPGHYILWLPQPSSTPVAWVGEAIGLDVRTSIDSLGVTLGVRGRAVLANVPTDGTLYSRLHFIPGEPAATKLRLCRGEASCANFGRHDIGLDR